MYVVIILSKDYDFVLFFEHSNILIKKKTCTFTMIISKPCGLSPIATFSLFLNITVPL